ncbi:MAG: WYL domain-containing protein [bacterium]|nr:WYL domain-containing protein [bacterium]
MNNKIIPNPIIETEKVNKKILIQECIEKRHSIIIEYVNSDNKRTKRLIDPYIIGASQFGIMYLLAYCHYRNSMRTFRCDKIKTVKETLNNFQILDDININAPVESFFGSDLQNSFVDRKITCKNDNKICHFILQRFNLKNTVRLLRKLSSDNYYIMNIYRKKYYKTKKGFRWVIEQGFLDAHFRECNEALEEKDRRLFKNGWQGIIGVSFMRKKGLNGKYEIEITLEQVTDLLP